MIEVFKTNVETDIAACEIVYKLHQHLPSGKINFDLEDCKKIFKNEVAKHINDTKTGKLLIRIYPVLMLVSVFALIFVSSLHYKGMALGFAFLFASILIIDNGFVSRSDNFLSFLKELQ